MVKQFLPDADHVTSHQIKIAAPPERVWPHVNNLDLHSSPLNRALFAIRGMGRVKQSTDLESFGFENLSNLPPNHLVMGLIGRFWKPKGAILRFNPDEFEGFNEPGFAKAAWSFDLVNIGDSTLLTTETRIRCTDDVSLRSFNRYWRLVGPFSGLVRTELLRSIKKAVESE